jgi:hypothetical protein
MADGPIAGSPGTEAVRAPYRLVVWGTGGMGRVAVSTVAMRRDFEIVGARVYSADKDGIDVGVLAGLAPVGVRATPDPDAALDVDADCVLHLARDFGRYDSVDELVAILRAGRNVITVHPFQFDHAMDAMSCPPDTMSRIAVACQEGASTFHSTGIHPEMVAARLVGTLTGLSTNITSIKFSENWDVRDRDAKTLSVMGYGRDPAELEAASAGIAKFTDNYCLQSLYGLSRLLGVEPARIESEHEYAPAPVDLSFRDMQIAAGSVARITRRSLGFRDHHDGEAFIVAEVNWMVGRDEMVPAGMPSEHHYFAVVEGTPSLSLGLGIKASMARDQRLMDPTDPTSDPGYWATIATVLQAVPRVCDASPGILGPIVPDLHWVPDFRELSAASPLNCVAVPL